MTDIKKNDIVDIDDFVDSLCERNGINSSEVYGYAKDHYDELQTIDRIFKLETEEDIRRCMALARILTPKWADSIIAFSRREKFNKVKLNWIEEPEISVYSLMLVAAFIYNPQFLKEAWDWCASTYQEAGYQYQQKIIETQKKLHEEPVTLNIRKGAATPKKAVHVFIDAFFEWNGIRYKGVCINWGDKMMEIRIPVNNTNNENLAKLKLVFRKGDIPVREVSLYLSDENLSTGKTPEYTTGRIPILESDVKMFIREIPEDDNA